MTGRGLAGAGSGVQTLTDRQFSSLVASYDMLDGLICGQMGPGWVASSVVVQALAGCGGLQRFAPPVVSAKGIPRKARTPFAEDPWTMPLSVITSRPAAEPPSDPPPSPALA